MIPLRDDNPTVRPPVVTVLILIAIAFVYFGVQPRGAVAEARYTYANAAIPCEVVQGRPLTIDEINHALGGHDEACGRAAASPELFPRKSVYLAVLVSMFLHANLLHIGGNALFLWVFGNNIEDRMGHLWYALFYLVGGLAAAGGYVAAQPLSTVPMIGASGAIAAVMGAYLVLFPRAPVRTLFILGFFVFLRDIPAAVLLAFWFVSQFFLSPGSGVAWMAHVGGFAFGAAVTFATRSRLRVVSAAA
ncbi:MAG TPA: rhomboid family intramembrane serine protease [Acidimicrobiales bacterium]|nr:rhomboid family intramembrane serine protease [Acidimicrobiales bacterium]